MTRPAWIILLLFCAPLAASPRVHLIDGRTIDGPITFVDGQTLLVMREGSEERVPLDRVLRAVFREPKERPFVNPAARLSEVKVSTQWAVPLNQSNNDAINGLPCVFDGGERPRKLRWEYLSDAVTHASPSVEQGWFSGSVTWDLGDGIPAENRQLDAVSIWIRASDDARSDYRGSLSVSLDGDSFSDVPGTFAEHDFPGNARANTFNNVRYQFEPGRVTRFRYLRFTAERPSKAADTRFVEVDAFVSRTDRDDTRQVSLVSRGGSEVVGEVDRLDDTSAVILRGRNVLTIPRNEVAQVRFLRLDKGLEVLARGRKGAMLETFDFLEGDVADIDTGTLRLSSVLFGLRRLDTQRKVVAALLQDVKPAATKYRLRTVEGSTYHTDALRVDRAEVTFADADFGETTVHVDQITDVSPGPARVTRLAETTPTRVEPAGASGSTADETALPLRLANRPLEDSVAVKSGATVEYAVPAGTRVFSTRFAVPASVASDLGLRLVVAGDGKDLARTEVQDSADEPLTLTVPLAGMKTLTLRVEHARGERREASGVLVTPILVR
jgi:hypothetical protein